MTPLPKDWYASRAIWASIVAALFPILAVLSAHFHVVLPDQDVIVNDLTALGTVIAAALAIYGRVMASQPIAKPSTPKIPPTPLTIPAPESRPNS